MGDLPARQEGAASVPEKGGGLQGAGMVYGSFMDMGVSQGKPFSLLWAETQMGLMLSLIPCRCGAGDSAQLDQSWGQE